MILHAITLDSIRPRNNAERVHQFRLKSAPLTDEARMIRDAQIAAGVRWLEWWRRRPIPKHRAMVRV